MYAIEVNNVSKKYKIGQKKDSLKDTIPNTLKRLFHPEEPKNEFLALDSIDFKIKDGESVGIIGPNGAGKSTILKLLSKITNPTSGDIKIYGKLAALIEVGAGFHPDLTGRENIFLNGSILGLKREDLDKKFDEIVQFSGLEKFIDTPIKRYSSGMSVRLGFSVAIHLDPDILLIDEVLAVGDMSFQSKCFEKMNELRKKLKAIIFISHNMDMVKRICQRSIFLLNGKIMFDGNSSEAVEKYRSYVFMNNGDKYGGLREGTGEILISNVQVLSESNEEKNVFNQNEKIKIKICYTAKKQIKKPYFSVSFRTEDDYRVFGCHSDMDDYFLDEVKGEGVIEIVFKEINLLPNIFFINVGVWNKNTGIPYDYLKQIKTIKISGSSKAIGFVDIKREWKKENI
ncbi:MAG: ABC transporter ATP-binding protein [bacterium]